ncbi:MAG TPA: hypothetical protein PKC31_01340, partial [Candidatus Nanoperiomorbaceae bacterium]|nr:hypothetical protein [Candidatus Nanoperiomorbaceae bacterium]
NRHSNVGGAAISVIKKPPARVGIAGGYVTLRRTRLGRTRFKRDPPHTWGPPVKGVRYAPILSPFGARTP